MISGAHPGRRYSLNGQAIIGRSMEADISLAEPSLSRKHCQLLLEDDHWKLQDLESTNGVELNGRKVNDCHPVKDGDMISLGKLVFLFSESTEGGDNRNRFSQTMNQFIGSGTLQLDKAQIRQTQLQSNEWLLNISRMLYDCPNKKLPALLENIAGETGYSRLRIFRSAGIGDYFDMMTQQPVSDTETTNLLNYCEPGSTGFGSHDTLSDPREPVIQFAKRHHVKHLELIACTPFLVLFQQDSQSHAKTLHSRPALEIIALQLSMKRLAASP